MKNIPVFTAAGGTATLILREIPAVHRAYAILQTHLPGSEAAQAEECAGFCRMAGAQEVYLTCRDGTALPLPHSHDMLLLELDRTELPAPLRPVRLEPLTPELEPFFLEQYRRRFAPVLNASLLDHRQLQDNMEQGSRAFLATDDTDRWVGLGIVHGCELEAVASLEPGWGFDVACALLAETEGPTMQLLVCSANERAMALYELLGFRVHHLVSRWYRAESSQEN